MKKIMILALLATPFVRGMYVKGKPVTDAIPDKTVKISCLLYDAEHPWKYGKELKFSVRDGVVYQQTGEAEVEISPIDKFCTNSGLFKGGAHKHEPYLCTGHKDMPDVGLIYAGEFFCAPAYWLD